VIDLVIKHVDLLLEAGAPAAASAGSAALFCPSTVSLRESFVNETLAEPLQKRFNLHSFIKVQQRDPMLIGGKLDGYLKKYAAKRAVAALKSEILNHSYGASNLEEIKELIESNREAVRNEWQESLKQGVVTFMGKQFLRLLNDLVNQSKTKGYSLKGMLIAFLQHIVNTDKMGKNVGLQQDLSGFINDLAYKVNSLRSLWARLDGQDDPCKIGVASARHVERRRQRELTQSKVSMTLGDPNKVKPAPDLRAEDQVRDHLYQLTFMFQTATLEDMAEMRAMLRQTYRLDVHQRSGVPKDLFCAFALVAYKSGRLEEMTGALEIQEQVRLAADQLRAVTAADMSHHFRTDERSRPLSTHVGEPVTTYIDRMSKAAYGGDLLCAFFLASHFRVGVRVWIPGFGSIQIRGPPNQPSKAAFQLMLCAERPDDGPPAASYNPTWFPVQLISKHVTFSAGNEIRELPMTDNDRNARLTDDEDPLRALGLPSGPVSARPLRPVRKRQREGQ